jgi:cyclophilin family peptidyl-prolyl cis-trans isomerase/HEAT repeat protein
MAEDVRILLKLSRSSSVEAARLAIRALGRYESREFIPELALLIPSDNLRVEATEALVRAFRGPAHPADRGGQQVQGIMDLLDNRAAKDESFVGTAALAIGQLPYGRADQAAAAQKILAQMLARAEGNSRLSMRDIVAGLEWFARRNRKLSPLDEDLVEHLRRIARVVHPRHRPATTTATTILALIGAVDILTLRATAVDGERPEKRRLSATVLGGSALDVDQPERIHFLKGMLRDDEVPVRIEAVRAWARRATPTEGCELFLGALKDPNLHVMLAAMDLLADVCPADENVTVVLTAEARVPPVDGSWHRAAHALLALAKRAPERARIPLAASLSHPTWEVRMYAARAAAQLKDAVALERLARDAHDNVREAALPMLRALRGAESDALFVEALQRADYQLLLTAAKTLEGAATTPELAGALMTALVRVTAEKKETSRDTRLALIERLGELGTPDLAEHLEPLLRDYDIPVALAALGLYEKWQGPSRHLVAPVPLPRPPLPTSSELAADTDAVIEMQSGLKIALRLLTDVAPLTVTRFRRLVQARYYDGLTFHRVVPNFIIQGGSPGANEYAGDAQFMRDEIGESNAPSSVGLSTRGRDTGDAQFYINLLDNRRLDPDYTVFARVCDVSGGALDAIREGDTISKITLEKWDRCRTPPVARRP